MRKVLKHGTILLFLLPAVLITYSTIFTSSRLPGGDLSDTVSQGYPFFYYTAESIQHGSIPHWNPYVFCGIPHFSSFGAPIFYPLRGLLLLTTGVEGMVRFLFPIQMLLGGVFAWLFLGSIGVSRWGRITGALAFAAGAWSNTLFYAGHGSKVICWSFLPLLLYSCEKWLQSNKLRFIALGALALGMQALSSHPQMILYSAGAAVIWSVFRTFSLKGSLKRNAVRSLGGLAATAILAIAIGAVQLLPGYNFSRYSNRAESLAPEQAASYSLPPEETLTMLFPHLFGYRHGFDDSTVSNVPLYFGRLGLRLSSEFTGIIPFLLALAAFLGFTKKYRWPLLTIAGAGMLISWGGYTPLFGLLYRIVPFFSKLRAPHMAAFLTTSALALAAGPGFDTLFVKKGKLQGKKFLYGIVAFAAVCILVFLLADVLLPGLQSSWWRKMGNARALGYSAVVNRRVQMASGDFLKAASAALVLAGMFIFRKKWKKAAIPGIVLTAALAAETIPINRDFQHYLPETSVEELFQEHESLAEMVGDGRLLPGGNQYIPYGIRSVEGYHGVKPQVSEDMRLTLSSGGAMALRQTAFTVFESGENFLTYSQFRDILLQQAAESDPAYADTVEAMIPPEPLPRVYFAGSWTQLSSRMCLEYLSAGLNTQRTAILYEDTGLPAELDIDEARAEIILDRPQRVVIDTENPGDGLLVLADTWYPRWKVFVDGEPAQLLQANHWQRAVAVPEGTHEVVFEYDSSDFRTGLIISIFGLILAAGLMTADRQIAKRKRQSE